MKASIDLSEVEDQLADCKPGDEYSVTFVVDGKTDEELTGTASEIEHLGEEEYDESKYEGPEAEERPVVRATHAGKRVPKAILLVSK